MGRHQIERFVRVTTTCDGCPKSDILEYTDSAWENKQYGQTVFSRVISGDRIEWYAWNTRGEGTKYACSIPCRESIMKKMLKENWRKD
jgi:hypothetical protein